MEDLKPYIKKQINRVKDKLIYCKIRKKWIVFQPEEEIRQAFLEYLIKEVKVPISNIYVEDHLKHWNIDKNLRVDIIVSYNQEEGEFSLLLIECKADHIDIKTAIHQARQYQKDIGAEIVIVTNGCDTLQIDSSGESKISSLPTYEKIIATKKIDAIKIPPEKPIDHKIPFSPKEHDRYKNKKFLIGEQIDSEYYDFIIALDQFFCFTLNKDIVPDDNEAPKIDKRTISVGEVRYDNLGNAGGGGFANLYRILYYKEQELLISLSSFTNDSNAGTSTILICGTEHAPSLQLNFKRYIEKLRNNQFLLWHDGRTGSGTTNKIVLQRVVKELPHLIKNNRIELGVIDIIHKLEWQTMKPIIKNILDYTLLRKKMREEKNKKNA